MVWVVEPWTVVIFCHRSAAGRQNELLQAQSGKELTRQNEFRLPSEDKTSEDKTTEAQRPIVGELTIEVSSQPTAQF